MKKMLVAILAVALLLPAALLCLPVGAAGTGRLALTSGEAKPGETFSHISGVLWYNTGHSMHSGLHAFISTVLIAALCGCSTSYQRAVAARRDVVEGGISMRVDWN